MGLPKTQVFFFLFGLRVQPQRGTLIFLYKRKLGPFLNIYHFKGGQKNEYFRGIQIFVNILGGHHLTGLFGVFSLF